ncbi:MAG: hypothetical protein VYC39_03090 [Myxococcota bacterium]|nr:hypothetical protein [Myxococcota bacterium]
MMRKTNHRTINAYVLALSVCGGCGVSIPNEGEQLYRIDVLSELESILPNETVRFRIFGSEVFGMPSIFAKTEHEQPVEIMIERGFSPEEWLVRPLMSWPASVEVAIVFRSENRTLAEFKFVPAERTWIGPPLVSVLSPQQIKKVPSNIKFLVVDVLPMERELKSIRLFSALHELEFEVAERLGAGRYAVKLRSGAGFCAGLCEEVEYEIWAEFADEVVSTGLSLRTSSVADEVAPTLAIKDISVGSDDIKISVTSNEPVLAMGRIKSALDSAVELRTTQYFLGGLVLSNSTSLAPGTAFQGEIEFWDLSGNQEYYDTGLFTTAERLEVEITELLPTPLKDWNDSETNGEPLDPFPGKGTVSSADEWIELVNRSSLPIDIRKTDLYVRVIDSRPSETSIRTAPATFLLDKQEQAIWLPNTALVLRLRGEMNQTDVVVQVFQGARLLDEVVIGKDIDSVHFGGRTPRPDFESIAKDEFGDWRWCVPSPGGATRRADCL